MDDGHPHGITTSGLNTVVNQQDNQFTITGGTQKGNNLFHSFENFNVHSGESTMFNDSGIQNTIGRITGHHYSWINGTISSQAENLYLMNPNGFIFGENANLDVMGSLHVTTADYLTMEDGNRFYADPGEDSVLTVDNVESFGFIDNDIGNIRINGAKLELNNNNSFSIVSGDIQIENADVNLQEGSLNMFAIKSPIDVEEYKIIEDQPDLEFGNINLYSSKITINGNGGIYIQGEKVELETSKIDTLVSGSENSDNIYISTKKFQMNNQSMIQSVTNGSGDASSIFIKSKEAINISDSLIYLKANSELDNAGSAGDILLETYDFTLTTTPENKGAIIWSTTKGSGHSGNISIKASNSVIVSGISSEGRGANILSFSHGINVNSGNSGNIIIETNKLYIKDGAQLYSNTLGGGAGGNINLKANELISISGRAQYESRQCYIASASVGTIPGSGKSGDISIQTKQLDLLDGATINSQTKGGGNAGDISIFSSEQIVISNEATLNSETQDIGNAGNIFIFSSGQIKISNGLLTAVSTNENENAGAAGNIIINTGDLFLRGAQINTETFGFGDAGKIIIHASGTINQSGFSFMPNFFFSPSIINTRTNYNLDDKNIRPGNAGDINIYAKYLNLNDGAQITSNSKGNGNSGNILIDVSETVNLSGIQLDGTCSYILSNSTDKNINSGNAGKITINAKNIVLNDGANVQTVTYGGGDGGDIDIVVSDIIEMSGKDLNGNFSMFSSNTVYNKGKAGDISIKTGSLLMNVAQISSATYGIGNAGVIDINADESIILKGYDTEIGKHSGISSRSKSENSDINEAGNSGNISLKSENIHMLDYAFLISSTRGAGDAGIIEIQTKNLFLKDGSVIHSFTDGTGQGGDIIIKDSDFVLLSGMDSDGYGCEIMSSTSDIGLNGGSAGKISMYSNNLIMDSGAIMSAETTGSGYGGDISLIIKDQILLSGQNNHDFSSGIESSAYGKSESAGNAGKIEIATDYLKIIDNCRISTKAEDSGGGKINIQSHKKIHLFNANITSSVENGIKNGGDISIDTNEILLNNSNIIANAYQGNGGNINIQSNVLVQSTSSIIDASSKLGIDGNVELIAPNEDFSKSLNTLPPDFLNASAWVKTPCKLRTGESASHFIMKSRDAMPLSPDDFQPSPFRYLLDHKLFSISNSQIIKQNFITGNYQKGIISLEKEINNNHFSNDSFILGKIILATEYQSLGLYQKARLYLNQLSPLVSLSESLIIKSIYQSVMGDIALAANKPASANDYYTNSLKFEDKNEYNVIQAMLLNNMGNFYAIYGIYEQAKKTYKKGLKLLDKGTLPCEEIKSILLTNMLRLCVEKGDQDILKIVDILETAIHQLKTQQDSYDKAFLLLSVATLNDSLCNAYPEYELTIQKLMANILNETLRISQDLNHSKLLSNTYGLLGRLYIKSKQWNDARFLTQKALFYSNKDDLKELSYVWHWQLASLFKAMKKTQQSIDHYQKAISIIDPIRFQFFQGVRKAQNTFDQQVKTVYLELTGEFLKHDEHSQITKAINTMEELKIAELQDFYKDECLVIKAEESKGAVTSTIPENMAIIYPVSFANHLSILVKTSQYIKHFKSDIQRKKLSQMAKKFQIRLQSIEKSDRSLYLASQLYSFLIAPIESFLSDNDIDTLVFIPDGALRLIPFSALKDETSEQFLIEKYSLITLPSLNMASFYNQSIKKYSPLIAGLSLAKDGVLPLPHVPEELDKIQSLIGGKVLQDENFTTNKLRSEFKLHEYNLLHIATHGHFGKSKEDTYLQTFDHKLTPDELFDFIKIGRYRENVDLLTLSACETALGDERAALGLAGISVQAGVKSAIATLWRVSDRASVYFTETFYQNLIEHNNDKAKALRETQLKMLHHPEFEHSVYWAPYLLIGI